LSNIKLNYKTKSKTETKEHTTSNVAAKAISPKAKAKLGNPLIGIKSFFKKVAKLSLRIVKSRKFLIAIGLIALVGISFFAGVKVGPYISNNNPIRTLGNNPLIERLRPSISPLSKRDSGSSPTNSRNVVFNGKITATSPTELSVIDKDGQTKNFLFNDRTVVVSKEGKTITNGELQIGYTVIIYASQDEEGILNISRLKILALN
jgi:hypothetical protein